MRREAKALAVELAKLELQLRPLLQRRDELRNTLKGKVGVGESEVVEGFLFRAYEKLSTSFDEQALIASLGDRAPMVTTPKLDESKLDSALQLGIVKSEELEPFTKVSVIKVLLVRPSSNGEAQKKGSKSE